MATQLDALFVEIFFKGDQRALDSFKRGWKQLDDGIKNTQQTLDRFAKRFAVAGAIGSAAMGLIGKAGLDTEEALLRTRAALSLTEDQMRTLHEEALKVGSQLPLNTKDIVNAQLAYGKLGASFSEILRDAPAIAGGAVATSLNPEQVATYARIIQNVFGGDVQENLDMLLRTANRSPSTFAALGESIQFSGQAAVDAGMDFRTYLATLGSTAGAGRSVESVSQGMAAMFGRLALATENTGVGGKRLIDVFGDVGINFRDVKAAMDGTSEGFVNVLRLMNEAELSTTQLTALLSTLAGHSYAASISYAVQNPEKLDELLAEIDSSTGEIVRQQEIILSGASGGLKEMMAQIDTLLNRLAQLGVLTAIETFTRGISKLVSWLTETNEEGELVRGGLLRMMTIMGGLLAALLPLGIALKAVSFALGGLVPLFKLVRGAVWLWRNALIMTRVQLVWLAISTRLATLANSQFVLSLKASRIGMLLTGGAARAMWLAITGPVGLAVAAFALVGYVIYRFRRRILDALMGVWNFIKGKWREIAGLLLLPILGPFALIATNAFGLRDKLIDAFTKVRDFFMGIWGTIVGIFRDHWAKILAVIFPAVGLPILIAQEWDQIVGIVGGIWSRVYDTVKGWIEAIISFIREIPSKVREAVKDIPNMVTDAVKDIPVVGQVLDVAGGVADKAKGFLGGIGKALGLAEGGIVPGPLGRPLLATVHGGEMVLPVGASNVLAQMLEGFRLGPAALPQAPYHYGQMYRSSVTNRTVNINMNEPIVIQTQATDAKGIAQELGEAIQDQIRNVAYDHDGPVER